MSSHDQICFAVRDALEQYFRDLDGEAPQAIYDMVLAKVEKPMLEVVLDKAQGNQTRAAELLGINRNTLRKKMQDHDLI
ncbi:helix-turn-helix domain-containing protein [Chitinimonas taiwanensis]|jgi:Fis family transcriptional regulator|uniref:Putative Fis-like DNA-binding protein n=1 Tax=Chitinimonas taiwanensis DSM 18899 TaxID=1121279 RepID=A0A1K2H4F4_9NEIS|nr:helix-turn-helix domain-containing protein [Chitinimonas taiwanensis]SFZ70689.1 Fis family transcriptional regulator, factor for inversion stimulation protein [Chitinimonas taiwanensis DSM 18899]